jgi:DNA-binding HxlR family transcriptional regulator
MYGQFCPVSKAMEVLDERWTMLVLREMLMGSTRFNDLRRGVPRMSPSLLSKRLGTLERAGVIRREESDGRTSYHLTESGQELGPIVDALGVWGMRWAPDLGDQDLDPHLLFWDMRRTTPVEKWPRKRTTVAFELDDVPAKVSRWWLVVTDGETDVCDFDPGFEVDARVITGLRDLIHVWRSDVSWQNALRKGAVKIEAPSELRRELPNWIGHSSIAALMS